MHQTHEELPGYFLSDDPARLELDRVHGWLSKAYWCEGIPRSTLERAIAHSLVFGVYGPEGQVAFARVVSDRATFAWLCDVIVAPEERQRGFGKWLVAAVRAHPELQGLRRLLLATQDAHGLYESFGFMRTSTPERWMEVLDRDVYRRASD